MDKSHKSFLTNLPFSSLSKVILKIILLLIIGLGFSFAALISTFALTKINFIRGNISLSALILFIQDFPVLLMALLLFYKLDIKEIKKQLSIAIVNWSPLLLSFTVVIIFIADFLYYYISAINKTSSNWKSLSLLINSAPNQVTLSYILYSIASLLLFLMVSFFEEFIFRFTIYRYLRKHGLLLALILGSLVFSVLHSQGFIFVFLFGIIISIYYEYSNNLLGAIVLHTLSNQFISFYAAYIAYLLLK